MHSTRETTGEQAGRVAMLRFLKRHYNSVTCAIVISDFLVLAFALAVACGYSA